MQRRILELTAYFGGDRRKLTAEFAETEQRTGVAHHQETSNWFTLREAALVKLAEVMDGNPVLLKIFENLFQKTAVSAIWRHYSNARGFFFLAPFLGGVILNDTVLGWERMSIGELDDAVANAMHHFVVKT